MPYPSLVTRLCEPTRPPEASGGRERTRLRAEAAPSPQQLWRVGDFGGEPGALARHSPSMIST
ncbi:MAG: hypothetical protein ACREIO_07970, partial [Nitrospiraceae bacterium]